MGLFNRKSSQERHDEDMRMVDDIAQGRGLLGKMSQAFLGSEYTEAVREATASLGEAERVAGLRAAGAPAQTATVMALQDTGQTINDNPLIVLTVDVDGQPQALQALVSRLEIPRVGEAVLVVRDPQTTALLYGGLAPRS